MNVALLVRADGNFAAPKEVDRRVHVRVLVLNSLRRVPALPLDRLLSTLMPRAFRLRFADVRIENGSGVVRCRLLRRSFWFFACMLFLRAEPTEVEGAAKVGPVFLIELRPRVVVGLLVVAL